MIPGPCALNPQKKERKMKRTWSFSGLFAALILLAIVAWSVPVVACDACPGQPQIGAACYLPGGSQPAVAADVSPAVAVEDLDGPPSPDLAFASTPAGETMPRTSADPPTSSLRLARSACGSGLTTTGMTTANADNPHPPLRC